MMRAAILLECDACGGRWCWPAFYSSQRGRKDAGLAAEIIAGGGGAQCPGCYSSALDAPSRTEVFVQAERAKGRRDLSGRPRTVRP